MGSVATTDYLIGSVDPIGKVDAKLCSLSSAQMVSEPALTSVQRAQSRVLAGDAFVCLCQSAGVYCNFGNGIPSCFAIAVRIAVGSWC